jgi:hypothetical protein
MMKSGERGKQIAILERKVDSQQRELFNARAKMKRLMGKQRRKPVDQPPWPEYSDDIGAHRGALSDDTRIGPQSRTSYLADLHN